MKFSVELSGANVVGLLIYHSDINVAKGNHCEVHHLLAFSKYRRGEQRLISNLI